MHVDQQHDTEIRMIYLLITHPRLDEHASSDVFLKYLDIVRTLLQF